MEDNHQMRRKVLLVLSLWGSSTAISFAVIIKQYRLCVCIMHGWLLFFFTWLKPIFNFHSPAALASL
ncbi:hypothetical protein EXN66_Car020728 [Channa argus]|uniref:Uncharacterized protein n=1 Tax=Channa argus TaxID=215402 RepID=A0A6G1QRE4_CHAAH|nr:hypothetical protein EXN66_Car020728 [Channa argus]